MAIYWTTVNLLFDLPAKKWSSAGSRKHWRIGNQSARADSCCGPTDIAEFKNRVVCNFVNIFYFFDPGALIWVAHGVRSCVKYFYSL